MTAFSEYLQSGVLDLLFNGKALAVPTNISIALTSGNCLDSDTGATIPEIPSGINGSGTGYSRRNICNPSVQSSGFWTYQGSGVLSNDNNIVFDTCLVDWGTVSGVAILDSPVYGSGKLLFHGLLTHPRDVYAGDQVKYDAEAFEVVLD